MAAELTRLDKLIGNLEQATIKASSRADKAAQVAKKEALEDARENLKAAVAERPGVVTALAAGVLATVLTGNDELGGAISYAMRSPSVQGEASPEASRHAVTTRQIMRNLKTEIASLRRRRQALWAISQSGSLAARAIHAAGTAFLCSCLLACFFAAALGLSFVHPLVGPGVVLIGAAITWRFYSQTVKRVRAALAEFPVFDEPDENARSLEQCWIAPLGLAFLFLILVCLRFCEFLASAAAFRHHG